MERDEEVATFEKKQTNLFDGRQMTRPQIDASVVASGKFCDRAKLMISRETGSVFEWLCITKYTSIII